MKNLIGIIFCILIISSAFTQNENDAEFLKLTKTYTLNDDGSMDYTCSKQLKINTYVAFNRFYGETFIVYNTVYQSLKINSAYTIMADGKKVETPANAFNEVLPAFSKNAPAYNQIREMVVTHTGLERGAIINLNYTIHTKKGFYNELMLNEVLSESSPVNELTIQIVVPESKNTNFQLLNIEGEPKVVSTTKNKTYTWTFQSIPANSKEYYQVHNQLYEPRLVFSTDKNLHAALSKFASQKAFDFSTNGSMNDAVSKITNDETDPLKVALTLQKVVCNEINNNPVPLQFNGFKCRTPIESWNSNAGTPLEKALLLTSLLKKAAIKAEVIAVIPDMFFNKESANLLNISEFLVRLSLKNHGQIFLSPTHLSNQNLKFQLEDAKAILLDPNAESLKIFDTGSSKNSILASGLFEITDTQLLSGEITLELNGVLNPYFRLINDSSYAKSLITNIDTESIQSVNLSKLSEETSKSEIKFSAEDCLQGVNNYYTWELPFAKDGVENWHINLLTTQRNSVLELPENIGEKYDFTVVIPENFRLVSRLVDLDIKNAAGHLVYKLGKKGNKIILIKTIELYNKIITPEKYSDFKTIMDIWNNPNYQKLIFVHEE